MQVSVFAARPLCFAVRAAVHFCSDNFFLAPSAQKEFGNYGFKGRVQPAGAFAFYKCKVACPKMHKMHLIATTKTPKIQKWSVSDLCFLL